jgi:hypothetical protein
VVVGGGGVGLGRGQRCSRVVPQPWVATRQVTGGAGGAEIERRRPMGVERWQSSMVEAVELTGEEAGPVVRSP